MSHPGIGSAVARYYSLWASLTARTVLFLGAHEQLPRVVTHPGIAPASNSLNFGVLTTPKPVSSQKASARRPRRHTRTTRQSGSDTKLSHPGTGSAVPRYCPLWASLTARTVLFLGAHEQLPRVVTHPGIAPASNSLNFGVLTIPKPVSSQKASC
ncbi:hypothetical protein L3X38_022495 [Prunus dulcis]|uniref:Uncharacterized protein n=1 Tax=Prunus dulcis TaxID=3755 RepID=A0AAD4VX14_PRUDU|nr:hypothetical protein L3X38_022495 [Prunus dulcis]